jgi:hypothetical protein
MTNRVGSFIREAGVGTFGDGEVTYILRYDEDEISFYMMPQLLMELENIIYEDRIDHVISIDADLEACVEIINEESYDILSPPDFNSTRDINDIIAFFSNSLDELRERYKSYGRFLSIYFTVFWSHPTRTEMPAPIFYFASREANKLKTNSAEEKIIKRMMGNGLDCLVKSLLITLSFESFLSLDPSAVNRSTNQLVVEFEKHFHRYFPHYRNFLNLYNYCTESEISEKFLNDYKQYRLVYLDSKTFNVLVVRTGSAFTLGTPVPNIHNRLKSIFTPMRKKTLVILLGDNHAEPKLTFPQDGQSAWWCWKCLKLEVRKYDCGPRCRLCDDFSQFDHEGSEICDKCGKTGPKFCIDVHRMRCRVGRQNKAAPCKTCRIPHSKTEDCHLTIPRKETVRGNGNNRSSTEIVYAADFESALDETQRRNKTVYKHTVNFAVAQKIDFNLPYDQWQSPLNFFSVKEFVDFFLSTGMSCQIWFHNFSGYDGRLIFFELCKRKSLNTFYIPRGSKFMEIKIVLNKTTVITFRDFMLHCAGSLEKNAKALLGVSDADGKQFFPYTFNNTENFTQRYVGSWPSVEHYSPHFMMPEKKKKFERWYQTVKDTRFDLFKHLKEYCESDVSLLGRCIVKYEQGMVNENKLSPLKSVTLPSYSFKLWKVLHYKESGLWNRLPVYPFELELYEKIKGCYRGGKTDVRMLRFDLPENSTRKMRYVDFNSMYPACMIELDFPVGKHEFIEDNLPVPENIDFWRDDFLGVVKVDLEVTGYMYHPLIASPTRTKMEFELNDLEGVVLCSNELSEALKPPYHYRITKVYWMLKYPKKGKIFDCVLDWYKKRLECKRKGEKVKSEMWKLLMNSLYGKFGENPHKSRLSVDTVKHRTVAEFEENIKKFRDEKGLFKRGYPVHRSEYGTTVVNHWDMTEEDKERGLGKSNVVIAAFITAQGRIRLNRALMRFGESILYHDTDSFIFVDENNVNLEEEFPEYRVDPDCDLGLLKDELEGAQMTSFIGLAAKTYCYKTTDTNGKVDVCIKMKGITRNSAVSEAVNYDTLCRMLEDEKIRVKCPQLQFVNNPKLMDIHTREYDKIFQFHINHLKGDYDPESYKVYPRGWERFMK